jgi:hypothetical protein
MLSIPNHTPMKQFIADIQKLVGSSAFVNFSTPTGSEHSWCSVVSPNAQLFTEFPYFLGDAHEPFSVPMDALISLASACNSKTAFSVENDTLIVSSGSRFTAELSVTNCTVALIEPPELENPTLVIDVSDEFLALFKSTLPVLGIEKVHAAQADFRLYVNMGRKKIFVAVYSPMQVVCAHLQNTLGVTGEFNVPYSSFLSLLKSLPKSGCQLMLGEDSILIKDPAYTLLQIVAPLSPKDPPGAVVQETSTALVDNSSASVINIQKSELESFLSSTKGIISEDTPVRFLPTKSGVVLESSSASSKTRFKVKTVDSALEEPFALELKFVRTLVSKSGDTVSLSVSDGILVMRSGSLGLITTTFSDNFSRGSDDIRE